MRVRVPQETSVSIRSAGYPEPPLWQRYLVYRARFAGLSGSGTVVPSTAQTSSPCHHTPAVLMPAAGPRSRSKSHRSGAGPTLLRAWTSAPPVGVAAGIPVRPVVRRCHTCGQPSAGNRAPASSR